MRVPVAERGRVSLDAQRSHLSCLHFALIRINYSRLVASYDAPQAAGLYISWAIRNVDVKHLCRAYAIIDFNSEGLHPARVKLYG